MHKNEQATIADYLKKEVRYICERFKNRSAGSHSEKECQSYFAKQLKPWADNVHIESFSLNPKAYLGWIIIACILSILSIASFWVSSLSESLIFPIVSALFVFLALSLGVFELLLGRKYIDFLFPKATSHNVIATRKSQDPPKKRIILGGHADAAYEMTYSLHGRKKVIFPIIFGFITGLITISICSGALLIASLIHGYQAIADIWSLIGIVELCFIPFFILMLWFINWNRVVDGANDNLSGCLTSMAILKQFAEKDIRFKETEICCLITGSEEAGLRGSLAFAKRHKQELSDVETVFIALETLREVEHLQIYTKGQNGFQQNCKATGSLLGKASKNCGYTLAYAKPFLGATDADAFSRQGLHACGLCGVNHDPQTYYHTRHDTWTNVDLSCWEAAFDICIETIKLYDQSNGIADFEEASQRGLTSPSALRTGEPAPF